MDGHLSGYKVHEPEPLVNSLDEEMFFATTQCTEINAQCQRSSNLSSMVSGNAFVVYVKSQIVEP
jgi:hypothetical protein